MPDAMRTMLLPLSWLYGLAAAARNRAFDLGLLPRCRASVPVIAVGNLTAGGTGKTPLVEYIAGRLAARGLNVAVVSRGYGRRSHGVVVVSCRGDIRADAFTGGDEPVQIARKFRSASVVVGERRAEAAARAVTECGAEVIVLDDAFQHRSIERDLDILVIDAGNEFFRERLLPAGMRREWFSGVRRAGLIGFSRAVRNDDPPWAGTLGRLSDARSFAYRTVIERFAMMPGDEPLERASLRGKRVLAFSGIGNHRAFVASLRAEGVEVTAEKRFRDHRVYSGRDLDAILENAAAVEACLTTEKDMVRLLADPGLMARIRGSVPFMYAVAGIELLRGEEILERAVSGVMTGRGQP
jgi:tetraacyldisaccharide 4'-kinase